MGNKLGWILAGGMLLAVALVILLTMFWSGHSPPTAATAAAGMLEIKTVQAPLRDVLGWEPSGPGNAGEDYDKAVGLYLQGRSEIDRAVQSRQLGALAAQTLRQVNDLLAAGGAKRAMQYTLVYAPKEMRVCFVRGDDDPADLLAALAQGQLLLAGQELDKKNTQAAEKVLQNAFLLGWHMAEEHARPYMAVRGMDVQREALTELGQLYQDAGAERAERLAATQRYLRELRALSDWYDVKSRIVRTPRPQIGDVFILVERDKDRAWRVQGLLMLGIVRFRAESKDDLRHANKLLDRYAASGEALEAAAAKAAKDLTVEQYRTLGTTY